MALPDVLLDTGAAIAILRASDEWHQLCTDAIRRVRLPLLTSEAVLTEIFHLFARSKKNMEKAWQFIGSGAVRVAHIEDHEFPAIQALMSRYWDRPMDFADATIVYLAERESISAVLTIDKNDFATYRIAGKRRFHILPIEQP
jgi:uncharacterized protein